MSKETMYPLIEDDERHTCIDIKNGRTAKNGSSKEDVKISSRYAECRTRSPLKKLGIAILYYITSMLIASYASVLANDWVPDKKIHPSLPDIVFNNTSTLSHGNRISDWLLVFSVVLTSAVVLSHKDRFIILRHFSCIICTLYMMRSIAILVTPLPLTEPIVDCLPPTDGSLPGLVKATFNHFSKVVDPNKKQFLCGDLMFSGHSCMYLVLGYFAHKYSQSYRLLQVLGWVLAVLGMISLVISRIHYTVDVVISIFLCAFSIPLHQIILDNPTLMDEHVIIRVLFPMTYYLETR